MAKKTEVEHHASAKRLVDGLNRMSEKVKPKMSRHPPKGVVSNEDDEPLYEGADEQELEMLRAEADAEAEAKEVDE